MEQVIWKYYQYRAEFGYPVYFRIRPHDLNSKLSHIFSEIGFSEMPHHKSKKIRLDDPAVKVLTIQEAGPRILQQINSFSFKQRYGLESLSIKAGMPVFSYYRVGMMAFPETRPLWDLALNPEILHTEQMIGVRVLVTHFLAEALLGLGILCYWGTIQDEHLIIMKQAQSFGEAVLIDMNKKMIFSNGGEMKLPSKLKITKKINEQRSVGFSSREELIGFLRVNTCLTHSSSFSELTKKIVLDLSNLSSLQSLPGPGALNL